MQYITIKVKLIFIGRVSFITSLDLIQYGYA